MTKNKPVKLIKASAGAGKTHYLTGQYIDLLLSGDADSYRHILAVTFTNKATDEMKSRVIEELYKISRSESDPRRDTARERLTRILHDYSAFSISTIDRFFQMVMRSFAREIGQYASYKVELDLDSTVGQAVDMMMESLEDPSNKALLDWLEKYSFIQIESGNSWNITKPLTDMSKLFFTEDFRQKMRNVSTIIEDKEAISRFDEKMRSIVADFRSTLASLAEGVKKLASDLGVDLSSLKGKSRGPFAVFEVWAKGGLKTPADFSKFEEALGGRYPELLEAASAAVSYYVTEYRDFRSAEVIRENLYLLGIYSDIYGNINQYLRDNNMVLLAQTTDLLERIIDGNDTPFVYEKTGSRYEHILLDESQDTSVLQWRNFTPLFKENVARGFSNLIVGDIKQSIYRWRGSDWKLISEYAKRDIGEMYVDDSEALEENWRSSSAVIQFNNEIFSKIGAQLKLEDSAIGEAVGRIYDGSIQRIPPVLAGGPEGRAKVGFIDNSDKKWREKALDKMFGDIVELHENGYGYGDITILVRKNTEGALVAAYLMEKGLEVITEDSLLVGSAPCVKKIVDIMHYVLEPELPVNQMLSDGFSDILLPSGNGSVYDLCETLIRSGAVSLTSDQTPFIQAFMDYVITYQGKYGSSLRGFVKWWDENCRKLSICAPDGQNAVRVMTIHKSKGLGLEAVIIPFMDEAFLKGGSLTPTIWCGTTGQFSELGLVPLKSKKELSDTIFETQYKDELLYQYIDSINTSYVALTRAKSQLVVYCPMPDKPDNYTVKSFASYLYSQLSAKLDSDGTFVKGSLTGFVSKQKDACTMVLDSYLSLDSADRLALSMSGAEFFSETVSARLRGIELHEILSRTNCLQDLERACEGDKERYEYLSEKFKSAPEEWFDGTYESLNENSIVDADGREYRPDRILVDRQAGKAIVVDYKFGSARESYERQVRNYCNLLSRMGFNSVNGFLWYVDSGKVCEVGCNC